MITLSPRAALIRNVLVSGTSGAITLVILLVAPLGLAAVIINTFLVTAACFFTSSAADRVVVYLQPKPDPLSVHSIDSTTLGSPAPRNIDRRF